MSLWCGGSLWIGAGVIRTLAYIVNEAFVELFLLNGMFTKLELVFEYVDRGDGCFLSFHEIHYDLFCLDDVENQVNAPTSLTDVAALPCRPSFCWFTSGQKRRYHQQIQQ